MKSTQSKQRSLAIGVILSSLATPLAFAQDLSSTLNQAKNNDPQWASTVHAYKANKELKHIASSGLKPTIALKAQTASQDVNYLNEDSVSTEAQAGQQDSDDRNRTYSATLSQPLFDLSKWHTHQQGKASDSQYDATFESSQQAFYMRVVKAYLDVLRAEESLQFRDAEKSAIKRQLEQTEQRFNVGLIANTDVQEAQAAFDISSVQHIIAEQDLALSLQNLETLTGAPINTVSGLKADAPISHPTPNNISEWTSTALNNNPDLLASLHAKAAAQQDYKSKRSGHLPVISLEGSYSDNHSDADNSLDYRTNQVSVAITLPLYSGGATSAYRRQSKELELKALDDYNLQKREVIQNTSNLFRVVNTDVSRVKAQKQSIRSAQAALGATEAGYDAGTRTVVDVLNAQKTLYGAKQDYANARFDYIFDSLQLKQTAGVLTEKDIHDINSWLNTK
ncbi:hypothetical protein A9Q99_02775 [Gammaproteobacteria bacterium 45_16_T64]|nr:hypothetical protein A9Q99_02775 [Gammaproteobacteria bacterium 45_16_T64]